jgi:asparaginyl-tRNA synthetase
MHYRTIKSILSEESASKIPLSISGWVRTKRLAKNIIFITINDGSTIKNLQIIVDPTILDPEVLSTITTGASICVSGVLSDSIGEGQNVELIAEKIEILGVADAKYPLQPKQHSMEFLRSIAHLRFRTSTISAVMRIRNALSYAIHRFFQDKGFINIHSPLITTIDGEGAGEMFTVTTLDYKDLLRSKTPEIKYSEDFFGTKTSLTVTGQLEAETAIFGLSAVYTFGPTFRAENSNTTRHLAEFWMIEPEAAFYNLDDNISLATDMLKYVIKYALDHCDDDLAFLEKKKLTDSVNSTEQVPLRLQLKSIIEAQFMRISYTEAIDILKKSNHNTKGKFKYRVEDWGCDLQTEHEKYLVEKHFQKPIIVTNYPKEIKAFYMRQNDDNATVAAMDILFPGIGEIIGGSQREERYDKLISAMERVHIEQEKMQWYIDTRRFGSVVHSGFGLGLERLVMFVTGMENIRDVIPFPRTPGNAYNSTYSI